MTRQPAYVINSLLLAVAWVTAPVLWQGPASLCFLAAALLGWRFMQQRRSWPVMGIGMRYLLLVVLAALVWRYYGGLLTPYAGVSLLAAVLLLKTHKMARRRDAHALILLGYFVQATAFLWRDDLLMATYAGVGVVLLLNAQIRLQRPPSHAASTSLRLATRMGLEALPLLVLGFILVPRITPIWVLPAAHSATTGLSDRMASGSISQLTRSSDTVFRAIFKGPLPPPSARYWRGMVYHYYDGQTWYQASPQRLQSRLRTGDSTTDYSAADYSNTGSSGSDNPNTDYPDAVYPDIAYPGASEHWYRALEKHLATQTPSWRYQILLAPSEHRWLFAQGLPQVNNPAIGLTPDLRLISREPVAKPLAYNVSSYPLTAQQLLPRQARRRDLQLPAGDNPRSRAWAKRLRAQSGSDIAYIHQLLARIYNGPFYYTLEPPRLSGSNRVDAFLFQSRRGFCEHYATAFAVMMRAADIPARVVAGYVGGTLNSPGHYLQIRQSDAHAWVEVWLQGSGWQRIDPTAYINPARVEASPATGLAAAWRHWQGGGLLGRIGMWTNYIDYRWQSRVQGFDSKQRAGLLDDLQGTISDILSGSWAALSWWWLLAPASGLLLWQAGWCRHRRRSDCRSPGQRQYRRLMVALERRGLPIDRGKTPQAQLQAAALKFPAYAAALDAWLESYQRLAYGRLDAEQRRHELACLKARYPFRRRYKGRPVAPS